MLLNSPNKIAVLLLLNSPIKKLLLNSPTKIAVLLLLNSPIKIPSPWPSPCTLAQRCRVGLGLRAWRGSHRTRLARGQLASAAVRVSSAKDGDVGHHHWALARNGASDPRGQWHSSPSCVVRVCSCPAAVLRVFFTTATAWSIGRGHGGAVFGQRHQRARYLAQSEQQRAGGAGCRHRCACAELSAARSADLWQPPSAPHPSCASGRGTTRV